MDSAGIPNILDDMNDGIVRVWKLDVDTSDTAPGSQVLVADGPGKPQTAAIRFID